MADKIYANPYYDYIPSMIRQKSFSISCKTTFERGNACSMFALWFASYRSLVSVLIHSSDPQTKIFNDLFNDGEANDLFNDYFNVFNDC